MGEQSSAENDAISLSVNYIDHFNYSCFQAFLPPVKRVVITNSTDTSYEDLTIQFDSATDLLTDTTILLPLLPAHESVEVDCNSIQVVMANLLQITERTIDHLNFSLVDKDDILCHETVEMLFWAFDQWNGVPEMLASFVTPNYPSLASLITRAAIYLEQWTGRSAFIGYQTGRTEDARMQAAALYRAIREEGIVYVGAPASFGPGQRVRMADAISTDHMATCLDFSLLYASCLEAVGLRPLIMLIKGHAFVGVWLEETSFEEVIESDYGSISKRCAKGVEKMTVVQSTDMARGSEVSFENAEVTGRSLLDSDFICAIDIHRARASQIVPLPIRVKGNAGWRIELEPEERIGQAHKPKQSGVKRVVAAEDDGKRTKKQLWERSLLDLSMRNNLLNMKSGSRAMPLLAVSLDEMEDMLALDKGLEILPKPAELPIPEEHAFNIIVMTEQSEKLFTNELREGRVRTAFTPEAFKRNMNNLYRSARSSLEETGANTLFLALGDFEVD